MKLTISEIIKIVKGIPTIRHEEDCTAWGCTSVHVKELIDPDSLIYVLKTLKTKKRRKK